MYIVLYATSSTSHVYIVFALYVAGNGLFLWFNFVPYYHLHFRRVPTTLHVLLRYHCLHCLNLPSLCQVLHCNRTFYKPLLTGFNNAPEVQYQQCSLPRLFTILFPSCNSSVLLHFLHLAMVFFVPSNVNVVQGGPSYPSSACGAGNVTACANVDDCVVYGSKRN